MFMKLTKTVMLEMCLSVIIVECIVGLCNLCCLKTIFKTTGQFSENVNFQNFVKTANSLKFKITVSLFSDTDIIQITCKIET